MKQIEECLNRFFEKKKPLKKKWQAIWHPERKNVILIFHYHHLILAFDTEKKEFIHEWWEKQADKRGLDASKEYLINKFYN